MHILKIEFQFDHVCFQGGDTSEYFGGKAEQETHHAGDAIPERDTTSYRGPTPLAFNAPDGGVPLG